MKIPRGLTGSTHSTEKLYKRWAKQRSILVPEWQDYDAFSAWAKAQGYNNTMQVRWRRGSDGLCGPRTCKVISTCRGMDEIPTEEHQARHRPCPECARERKGCTTPCERYLAWYNATMAAYRRALGMEEHKDE